jgi:hypothetical protein
MTDDAVAQYFRDSHGGIYHAIDRSWSLRHTSAQSLVRECDHEMNPDARMSLCNPSNSSGHPEDTSRIVAGVRNNMSF